MTNQPKDLRGLKALVGILAVLIIIGTTVVAGTVIHRLYARFTLPPTPPANPSISAPAASSISEGAPPKALALPGDEHIMAITGSGADIAILVTTTKGEKLLILNPDSGTLRTALTSP